MNTATTVTERPILMNADMVRPVLAGRKRQTRRPILLDEFQQSTTDGYDFAFRDSNGGWNDVRLTDMLNPPSKKFPGACPFGKVGDRLWVRETWKPHCDDEIWTCVKYRADGVCIKPTRWTDDEGAWCEGQEVTTQWRPSIHMPRWASRITLEITDVRVQRVQDISEEDAKAEGCIMEQPVDPGTWVCPKCNGEGVHGAVGENLGYMEVDCVQCDTPIKRFRNIWDSIYANGPFAWDASPWVWALTFKRVGEDK